MSYLTIVPRACVGYELAITISCPARASGKIVLLKMPKELQYLSFPSAFVDVYRLPYFVVNGI